MNRLIESLLGRSFPGSALLVVGYVSLWREPVLGTVLILVAGGWGYWHAAVSAYGGGKMSAWKYLVLLVTWVGVGYGVWRVL